jgi:cephalosporin-C deacetylase-like acetyl esterase
LQPNETAENDFFMRSLWKDFALLENTLFELQKVGNELAASSGDSSGYSAHSLSVG